MALREKQKEIIIKNFAISFGNENDEYKRKSMYIEFEDSFNASIENWQGRCRKIMEEEHIEHFDRLTNRHDKSELLEECCIDKIFEEDFYEVEQIIKMSFGIFSISNSAFERFCSSKYSFLVRRKEEVLGIMLAYDIPDVIFGKAIYIDSFAVLEAVRGNGLGKMMMNHLAQITNNDRVHFKLSTIPSMEAYQIYKHWNFEESEMVIMTQYNR